MPKYASRASRGFLAAAIVAAAIQAGCEAELPTEQVEKARDGVAAPMFTLGGEFDTCVENAFGANVSYIAQWFPANFESLAEDLLIDLEGDPSAGYDLFVLLEETLENDLDRWSDPTGARVANAVLDCMELGASRGPNVTAASIADGGALAVRCHNELVSSSIDRDTDPVLERQPAIPSEVWGAEPAAGDDWCDVSGGGAIILTGAPFDGSGLTADEYLTGYSWEVYPTGPFASDVVLGSCIDADPTRLQRLSGSGSGQTSGVTVLETPGFCASALASRRGGSGALGWLTSRIAGLVSPRQLVATAGLGGTGGKASSFSDWVIVDMGSAGQTAFGLRISNQFVNVPFPVKLDVRSENGSPIPGAEATFTVYNNRGKPVELTATPVDAGAADTDGSIEYLIEINKPGGYKIDATIFLDGFTPITVRSNRFNLKYQKGDRTRGNAGRN